MRNSTPRMLRSAVLATAFSIWILPAADDPLLKAIPDNFRFAAEQYDRLLTSVKDDPKIPRTFVDGKVKTVGPQDWTSGFVPGSLWYLHEFTGEAKWRKAAEDYTRRLESIKDYPRSHDVGFMLFCSYGNGYRLTRNPAYKDVLIQGAKTLAGRFNPKVEMIRSWDHGKWTYPVIVDNMMNLELLTWAAREGSLPDLKSIATSHADRTMKEHYRPDFSSYHVVDFNPTNGQVLARKTHQGAADESAWARGQAWGLYGYTMMFRETRKPDYLTQATRIANFILNHPRLPSDKVPYWDFDASGIPNTPRDASAAAIISSALIELSGLVQGKAAEDYLALARQQLLSLSSPAYRARPGENGNFILQHCVGSLPGKSEVDVPLNYADYYFLEGLLRYRAKMAGR